MATTLDIYTHANGSAQRDALNLLEEQLFPNVPKLEFSKLVVGAPGFEPGASCAQGRRPIQNRSQVFTVAAEKQRLSRDHSMWLAVYNCANLSVGWAQNWVHF